MNDPYYKEDREKARNSEYQAKIAEQTYEAARNKQAKTVDDWRVLVKKNSLTSFALN